MGQSYIKSEKKSVLEYAKKLINRTLREVCDPEILKHKYSGKGNFGQVLEKYYFNYEPNSEAEADFKEIGLELKSSPLKKLNNNEYRSKERLVLNIINYFEVVKQDFATSSFWKKNANILLIFYIYIKHQDILDHVIKLVDEWIFPPSDLEIIKRDWETIKNKVVKGKAHELSEGDTMYLGACTKGGKGGNARPQPFSKTPAKQRAYSLKQGYVNHIIASIAHESQDIYGKLIKSPSEIKKKSLEDIVISKFTPYIGLTTDVIIDKLDLKLNAKAKNFYANLTKAILGVELDKDIEEFQKAEIVVKTVRLKTNDLPKEDISFPTFRYTELIKESWSDSEFKNLLEHKFLFIFFQFQNGKLVLKKVKFWNMPYEDIQQAKKVWLKTISIIKDGNIVNKVTNKVRHTNFPNKSFNQVSHVRPHALKASDTYPLPVTDKVTKSNEYTKHCFWLNNTYVRDEIYLK